MTSPSPLQSAPRRTPAWVAILAAAGLGGGWACDIQVREGGDVKLGLFSARATQEWTRSYTLPAGAQIEVANVNGPIELSQAPAGSSVEIRADITAKALTDEGAKEILSKGRIDETASATRVKIETVVPRGVHGSYEVRYTIRLPASVEAQISTMNGRVKAEGVTGTLKVSAVNGTVDLNDMAGAIDASTVNGSTSVKLASVTGPVRLETTNGRLTLELPKASRAYLAARVVNGRLSVSNLPVEEQRGDRTRRIEVVLNGGGPTIDLRTTNGRISITGTP
jgi:hypothetical protein